MAINLPHKILTIDINREIESSIVCIANVNDKGTRFIDVKLTADGTVIDLSDCAVLATFVTDKVLISDSIPCEITNNIICVPLQEFKSRSGIMNIELKITSQNSEKVINTPIALKVRVTPSIATGAHICEISYGTTADILKEVAVARGKYNNLNERLASIDSEIDLKADKATTLDGYGIENAYTKANVNELLASKANLSELKGKEDTSKKVSDIRDVNDNLQNYPSVEYLKNYYFDIDNSYSREEVDSSLALKADKENTYTKSEINALLEDTGGNDYVLTNDDKTEIAQQVLSTLPNGDEVSY